MLLSLLEGALAPIVASIPPVAIWNVGATTREGLSGLLVLNFNL